MRVRSLWANIQGSPYPVFDLQGAVAERFIRQIRPKRRQLEVGARFACSKRDSRPTKRFGFFWFKEAKKECKISSSSQKSKKKNLLTFRNSQTTQRINR